MTQPPIWRERGMRELAALSFTGFIGIMVLLPVAPLWAVHGGAGTAGSGLVNGVMLGCTVGTQLFVPRLLARFGWPAVLSTGMVLIGAPALLYGLSDALAPVLVLSGVRGVGFGILTVAGSSAVAHLVEPARRGAGIGFYGLAIALPNLLVLPVGPWLAEHVGFWLAFLIGAMPLVGVLPARRLAHVVESHEPFPDDPAHARAGSESVWVARRRLLRPMLMLLSVTLTGGALITFMPQMVDSGVLTVLALFVMGIAAALARWRIGAVADRLGAQRFLWPLLVLAALGTALTAWSVPDAGTTRAWALLVGVTAAGLGYGALQNLTLMISFQVVSRARHDLASSTWNAGFDLGTALGSIAVGAIAAAGSFPVALLVAAAVTLSALALVPTRRAPQLSAPRPAPR